MSASTIAANPDGPGVKNFFLKYILGRHFARARCAVLGANAQTLAVVTFE
jgi:hypothetical protein